jgi:hypothetical protein
MTAPAWRLDLMVYFALCWQVAVGKIYPETLQSAEYKAALKQFLMLMEGLRKAGKK